MRRALLLVLATACGSPPAADEPDAAIEQTPDAALDAVAPSGFGELSGMCGALTAANLTDPAPALFRATMTFARRYNDPADRPLLTPGGQHLAATPNAGGSSGFSEIFAYEELARCETATLLHTETEISYDTAGKITDLEVRIGGEMIGVSVTRAQTYPLGTPYTESAATTLLNKKLGDIQLSTANVADIDQWRKQVLAILAWDTQAADTFATAWAALDPGVKADTLVVITTTEGDDTFIYTNQ
jgi:hypothetical protein